MQTIFKTPCQPAVIAAGERSGDGRRVSNRESGISERDFRRENTTGLGCLQLHIGNQQHESEFFADGIAL